MVHVNGLGFVSGFLLSHVHCSLDKLNVHINWPMNGQKRTSSLLNKRAVLSARLFSSAATPPRPMATCYLVGSNMLIYQRISTHKIVQPSLGSPNRHHVGVQQLGQGTLDYPNRHSHRQ